MKGGRNEPHDIRTTKDEFDRSSIYTDSRKHAGVYSMFERQRVQRMSGVERDKAYICEGF